MEASFFTEIVNGNTAVLAVAVYFIYKMHKQAMVKIEGLTTTLNTLVTKQEVTATEIKNNEKRFTKLESETEYVRKRCLEVSNGLHDLKQIAATKQELQFILEKK